MKRAARVEPDVRVAALVKIPLQPAGIRRLARAVLAAERAGLAALSVTFVGPARIRRLNRERLRHDRVTDVIAFAFSVPVPRSPFPVVVGDVYICPSVAAANARRHGATIKDELRRLVVHGTLHVLGHDHPADESRTASPMWRRQERYLKRFGALAR